MKSYLFLSLITITTLLITSNCDSTGSGTDGIPSSIEGLWESGVTFVSTEDRIMRFDLNQEGSSISGEFIVEFVSQDNIYTYEILDGKYNQPNLTITSTIDATGKTTETYSCNVQDMNTMKCDFSTPQKKLIVTFTKQ